LEFIAFVCGIASVLFAKKENILVYPIGLVSTIITVYLLFQAKYFADMAINFYYSIMSVYGWLLWNKTSSKPELKISRTTKSEKFIGIGLFFITMIFTYSIYHFFDYKLEIPNYIDILTSGIFFTAMWFMAKKKIENWTLWIIGDLIVVPLYAYRGLGMLAVQYFIFTLLALLAYNQWRKSLANQI
jgi:nicotinamide mononucleotide transporter